mmetsp:Transcript_18084/g.23105  ORF Transcript_18084/g.23105 Transcript_18084/m.23105 type:complete len:315 (+) Transcript_18084:76-1020(+)
MSENITKRLGFLGVGTIGHAVVRGAIEAGLLTEKRKSNTLEIVEVFLSPRGKGKLEDLRNAYESLKNNVGTSTKNLPVSLNVCSLNQEVVDNSDWLFIGIHHKDLRTALKALTFRKDQILISMASAVTRDQIFQYCSEKVPMQNIYRVTPLPACKHLHGTTLIYPRNERIAYFFDCMGSAVQVDSVDELLKLQTATAFMGDFYQRKAVITNWLREEGVNKQTAASYVAKLFATIISDAVAKCETDENVFEHLVAEQTPGGLNEAVVKEQREAGAYDLLVDSLKTSKERFGGGVISKRKETEDKYNEKNKKNRTT